MTRFQVLVGCGGLFCAVLMTMPAHANNRNMGYCQSRTYFGWPATGPYRAAATGPYSTIRTPNPWNVTVFGQRVGGGRGLFGHGAFGGCGSCGGCGAFGGCGGGGCPEDAYLAEMRQYQVQQARLIACRNRCLSKPKCLACTEAPEYADCNPNSTSRHAWCPSPLERKCGWPKFCSLFKKCHRDDGGCVDDRACQEEMIEGEYVDDGHAVATCAGGGGDCGHVTKHGCGLFAKLKGKFGGCGSCGCRDSCGGCGGLLGHLKAKRAACGGGGLFARWKCKHGGGGGSCSGCGGGGCGLWDGLFGRENCCAVPTDQQFAYPGMNREDATRYIEGFQYYPPYQLIRAPRDHFMFDVKYGIGQ